VLPESARTIHHLPPRRPRCSARSSRAPRHRSRGPSSFPHLPSERPPAVYCQGRGRLNRGLREIDERSCGRRHEAVSGVVEKRSREAPSPRFEDGLEHAAIEVGTQPLIQHQYHANPGDCGVDGQLRHRASAHEERPRALDSYLIAGVLKLPRSERTRIHSSRLDGFGAALTDSTYSCPFCLFHP